MDIRSQLLSYEELHKQEGGVASYTYVLEGHRAKLFYFGSRHIFNPDDHEETIEDLKDFWKKFQEETEGERVVFIEGTGDGSIPDEPYETESEALNAYGESGLAVYLAMENGIPVESPEIRTNEYTQKLAEKFPKEQVIYFLVVRSLAYNRKQVHQGQFADDHDALLEDLLKRWKEVTGWDDLDFSAEMIKKTHSKNFNGEFDIKDGKFLDAIRRPGWKSTITNQVAQETGRIRDVRVVKKIKNKISEGVDVFIVFGLSHARIQEPALRALIRE